MIVDFNEALHEYRIGGVKTDSVTQILEAEGFSDFGFVDEEVLAYFQALGSAVHFATELDDRGELDESTVEPEVFDRLQKWRDFKIYAEKKGWLDGEQYIEKRLGSIFGFAGTPDRFFINGRRLVLIDIKTGCKTHAAQLQTAAYVMLIREYLIRFKITKVIRMCAYLRPEPWTPKNIVFHENELDEVLFKSLLNVHTLKKRMGIK